MKNLVLALLVTICSATAWAQTDITKYYLENYGFDSNFDYPASSTAAVAQELLEIDGWTAELSANYTITGVYEFGFQGTFNNGTVPSEGYDGEAGGGLALSTGWDQTFMYYQTITLPAGTYTVNVPTYNGFTATKGTSLLAWEPGIGQSVTSTLSSYPAKKWTLDTITFTLTETTTGNIQIGYKAGPNGSANSANLVIDYVQILATDMAVDKTELTATIASAGQFYGDGTGEGAADLKAAIESAEATANDETVDMVTVLEATKALDEAIAKYRSLNISEENPMDYTSYILNPSFEQSGSASWTSENLQSQTNSSFTKKSGTTYLEKWVSQGNAVGNASLSQAIKIPAGKYKLTVAAQNLNQGSTSQQCTGAYIYAGDQQTPVYTPADYSVVFTSISGQEEIGFIAQGATGNWLAVDNFRLYLIGVIDIADIVAELQRQITEAEQLQPYMMTTKAATDLQTAIDAAKLITTESTEASIQAASIQLTAATTAAAQSIAEYAALQAAIAEAEPIYDETKEGAAEFLAELDKAKALVANGEATSEQLADEIEALSTAVLLFNVANGSGNAPRVTTNTSFYIPAAHGALIRATISGNNIIERGICWSTEPEPTIADHRSTDYYSQKGTLFHVKNMEPASTFYARPYAITRTYAVGYGEPMKIVTLPQGTCRGTWDEGGPSEEVNTRCRKAIQETIDYLNEWTAIKGFTLSGHYGASTPTADCSYGGWMRIGPNSAYQAIGTVLHETGHGVGVGTHWRWNNCTDTRESEGKYGKWLGSWANKTLRFLENTTSEATYMTGDAVHGWGVNASYDWFVNGADKDKHTPAQYIGGCALLYALYIDGLCPTDGYPNGVPGYTFNFEAGKKYYIKCEDEERGLNDGYLFQRTSTSLSWAPKLETELNDSAAWYVEFTPANGYYQFKNVATGRYMTHSASGTSVNMKNTSKPSSTENFQLLPGRNTVDISVSGENAKQQQSYWFTWSANNALKSMEMGDIIERYAAGNAAVATFNFSNEATKQRYIILSEEQVAKFADAIIATDITSVGDRQQGASSRRTVTGIYTANGTRVQHTAPGINIIRYSDGTSRKVMVR